MVPRCRQPQRTGPRVSAKLAWYAFGNPGLARKVAGHWFAFFLPGYIRGIMWVEDYCESTGGIR